MNPLFARARSLTKVVELTKFRPPLLRRFFWAFQKPSTLGKRKWWLQMTAFDSTLVAESKRRKPRLETTVVERKTPQPRLLHQQRRQLPRQQPNLLWGECSRILLLKFQRSLRWTSQLNHHHLKMTNPTLSLFFSTFEPISVRISHAVLLDILYIVYRRRILTIKRLARMIYKLITNYQSDIFSL